MTASRLQTVQVFVLSCLLGLSVFALPAQGAQVHASPQSPDQVLSIPLSPDRLDAEISEEQAQRRRANEPTGSFEFGVSSWRPRDLQPISRVSDTAGFGFELPDLNLNLLKPLNRDFSWVGGIDLTIMKRAGTLQAVGENTQIQQTVYLPSILLGGEFSPVRFQTRLLKPYLRAALLPSAVITSRSSFDDGQADLGLCGELAAGAVVKVSESLGLNLGISQIMGKVKNSDLGGFGVNAAMRVPL